MKKMLSLMLASALALSLVSCGGSGEQASSVPSQSTPAPESVPVSQSPETTAPVETASELNRADTFDKIEVTMELDAMLSQAIVTISNNSTYVFDGNVSVYFKNTQGNTEKSDMIFVEDLTPGNFTYARIDLDKISEIDTMEYTISDSATFVPAPSAEGGTLDEETSQNLAADFRDGFGGAGNPEYATSWYHYVVSVEVFDSGDMKNAVVTVSDDATSDAIDRIGNTVFANYTKDYSIASVEVKTASGEQVFTRTW